MMANKTDRELLEAAAKAAGIDLYDWDERTNDYASRVGMWNPLTDDGDAFRLAVKLKIRHGNDGVMVVCAWQPLNRVSSDDCSGLVGDDPYAATRRAIVRAAAEIGK